MLGRWSRFGPSWAEVSAGAAGRPVHHVCSKLSTPNRLSFQLVGYSHGVCPNLDRPPTGSKVSRSHRALTFEVTIDSRGVRKISAPPDHLSFEVVAHRRPKSEPTIRGARQCPWPAQICAGEFRWQSALTMASLELVEFINSQRKPGEPELRHDNFMAKVPKVLGDEAALNLKGSYLGKDGTTRPCYNLPKREACLMAMNTRAVVQASVFVTGALPIRFAVPRPATRAATPAAATGLGLSCHGGKQNRQQTPTKLSALHCLVPSLPV